MTRQKHTAVASPMGNDQRSLNEQYISQQIYDTTQVLCMSIESSPPLDELMEYDVVSIVLLVFVICLRSEIARGMLRMLD